MSFSILTVGSPSLLMPTEQAMGNPVFVEDNYAEGFKQCDQKYSRIRLQHSSDEAVLAMDAKKVLEA